MREGAGGEGDGQRIYSDSSSMFAQNRLTHRLFILTRQRGAVLFRPPPMDWITILSHAYCVADTQLTRVTYILRHVVLRYAHKFYRYFLFFRLILGVEESLTSSRLLISLPRFTLDRFAVLGFILMENNRDDTVRARNYMYILIDRGVRVRGGGRTVYFFSLSSFFSSLLMSTVKSTYRLSEHYFAEIIHTVR